jgi:hypothetical protein
VLDGINVEELNIPSTVICTDKFMEQGKTMASVHGLGDFPLVEIFHPIANKSANALREEAYRIARELVAAVSKK